MTAAIRRFAHPGTALLLVAALGSGTAHAQLKAHVPSATPAWTKGIQAISAESYWNAVECGKQGGENPPCVFYDSGLCRNADFALALYTPYKLVAYAVWQAVRKGQPAPKPSYAEAQRTRVVLGVTRVAGSKNTITGVTITRGAQTVKPATQSIEGTKGTFIFDFGAFAATSSITLQLAGTTASHSCLVERSVLARFR
jgi:hypothetical protein